MKSSEHYVINYILYLIPEVECVRMYPSHLSVFSAPWFSWGGECQGEHRGTNIGFQTISFSKGKINCCPQISQIYYSEKHTHFHERP